MTLLSLKGVTISSLQGWGESLSPKILPPELSWEICGTSPHPSTLGITFGVCLLNAVWSSGCGFLGRGGVPFVLEDHPYQSKGANPSGLLIRKKNYSLPGNLPGSHDLT